MANIYKSEDQSNNDQTEFKGSNLKKVSDLSQQEIIRFFNAFIKTNRKLVIPIGFPKAGKSMFLSSLFYYSEKNSKKPFEAVNLTEDYYKAGNISRDMMVNYFVDGQAYPETRSGTIDLIGIDINPKRKSLPKLRLGMLDLAGEDLEKILTKQQGDLNNKINGILKAFYDTGVVFCLVTPYRKPEFLTEDQNASFRTDDEEDQLQRDFINFLQNNHKKLLAKSKFILLVSQWDNNEEEDIKSVEQYIKERRPSLYNLIDAQDNIVYGAYSVGRVENTSDKDNKEYVLILNINEHYPRSVWSNLYSIMTGKSFNSGCLNWLGSLFK